MWAKLSNALKPRPTLEETESPSPDVMSGALEKHPNLSVYHNNDDNENRPTEESFPVPSPPSSPSRQRNGVFRRMSKASKQDGGEPSKTSTLKLSLRLPKKVKSHLSLNTNASQVSVNTVPDSARLPPTTDPIRPSIDSMWRPETPMDGRYGSIRSILRDRNTPATGQSVRFFSRDAFKIMTPEGSATSEQEASLLLDNLNLNEANPQVELSPSGSRLRHRIRAPVQDLFPPAQSTSSPPVSPSGVAQSFGSMMPIPPPEVTNIFDMSQRDLSLNTDNAAAPLLDDAVEIFDTDQSMDDETQQVPQQPTPSPTVALSPKEPNQTVYLSMESSKVLLHDRSQSFSFGQTVFRPMPKGHSTTGPLGNSPTIEPSPGRNRVVSESMFHTLSRNGKNPESDINDPTSAAVVLYSTPAADRTSNLSPAPSEPDPFRANATTFYTPGTLLPPSPPTAATGHARKPSKEEGLIWSLRTQLALQQELCAQYEVDLGARDALVSALTQRVETAEKDNEKRRGAVRGWKKKVQELERLCRNLEEEVDRSREESVERSIIDEASGEALRQLHKQIAGLEREKDEMVRTSLIVLDPPAKVKEMEDEIANLREELRQRDEIERDLQGDLRAAQEQIELLNTVGAMDDESRIASIAAASEEQERHRYARDEWEEERKALRREAEEATRALAKKEEEMVVLHEELEAQWKNTERAGERMAQFMEERNVLQSELVALEAKIESMELEWNNADNRRSEAENALQEVFAEKETLEQVKVELEAELAESRQHADDLNGALLDAESLRQELKSAKDSITRLKQDIRQRDAELEELAHRIVAHEDEVEDARTELTTLKRERVRTTDEHGRALADLTMRTESVQAELEAAVRAKDDANVAADSLRERVGTLEAELEKLRKQVRDLQAESANREVHISQMEKQRERDREDLQGLNIALYSKQQELELMKRRMSVKGTAGTTPAPSKVNHIRRESTTFSPPSTSRPVSRLSDASKDAPKVGKGEVPSTTARVTALGKSVRINATATTPTGVAPNKVPTPTTVKPSRAVEGSVGPSPPTRQRASLSTTTSPTGVHHTRVPSASSALGRSGTKSPPAVTAAGLRRPSSMSGTELLRQTKLATAATASSLSDMDRSTSQQSSSGSVSDEKENTMRPSHA
ncbi:hypothetical protein B0F90DRAFT_650219 [Multifurca ochricompacta]|uniref:Uncharacterized protein n=1 Tax=Multifurca ochricompacta TaxID=376703 RepID=A0AAD4M227_9AGAM|nr:hypothetical protein B0F90DRAFT_650219 [Multifurca ochricompacta]